MDLTLTVVVAATGSSADLHLTALDPSPAAPLLSAMRAAVGADPDVSFSVDGRPVVIDGTVADCGFVDGVVVRAGAAVAPPPAAPTDLIVTSGPDAGQRLALTDGDHIIGRDPRCELPIADASISRRHLLLTVSSGATIATDLESANGTLLDGRPLASETAAPVPVGAALRLGESEISIVAGRRLIAPSPLADGGVVIHRAPRLQAPPTVVEIAFPTPPTPPASVRIPILAAIAPLIAGVVLALVLHQWQFLAFTVLSPIMILGQASSDRWSARRTARAASRDHDRATATAGQHLVEALDSERRRRHDAAPDLAQLTAAASRRTRALWHRTADEPDALTLRLGLGDLVSEIRVLGGSGAATVAAVPVCIALPDVAVMGICGPRDLTAGLLRSLIVQAVTLLSPADLRLVVLAPGRSKDWAWVRWLPHVAARGEPCTALVGFDDDQVTSRVNELNSRDAAQPGNRSRTLVVVDGTEALRASGAVAALLERSGTKISVVWCAGDEPDLPGACRAVVQLSARHRPELRLARAGHADRIQAAPDLLAADVAEATARSLAPLRAGRSEDAHGLPCIVRWSDVSDIALGDHDGAARSLARQWSLAPTTEIALGHGADGVVRVDLCRDGPHALVAGTTGSGKSELLLSMVASLAARNRPDQLSLLLIDHKGGAAFGQCARLPHTVGIVTDLDGASTQRALLSLTAELRRRESLFAAVGVSDLAAYTAALSDTAGAEPLARLVIVVDEFATLAEEQPEFIGGLVGIAQRGRSLGVHLVLATQRPGSVVSADIRANTRLRICLGVARDNESRDVIDCPDAASISRTTPGRAYLRVGPGDLREFQAAHIGGARMVASDPTVTLSPAAAIGDLPVPPASDPATDTDLDALIDAAIEVTAALRCATPSPPWLPPLRDLLPTSELPTATEPGIAAWGLVDLPAAGQQRLLPLDLHGGGTTLIAGAARSGRTSAALTLATTAAARLTPDQLQLWAIDAGAGLAVLCDLPHCGAILPAHDADRIERLLGHLTREVSRRRHNPGDGNPALMLVIDSWEGLVAASDDRDSGRCVDTMLRLAADGPSAGLHTVITSDRGGLVGRLGATASDKIVLRLADPGDFALVGMPARDVPRHLPAGRGVRAADLALVQIGCLDDTTATAARAWLPPRRPVRRFDPLPDRVSLADVTAAGDLPVDRVILGRSADDLSPLTVARREIGTSFVIAGPPGSGRSSAMLLLARQLSGRKLVVSCARRSPLVDHADAVHLPRDDQDHALAILDSLCSNGAGAPDILIDDIDLLAEGPLWARLEELVRGNDDGGRADDDWVDGGRVIALAGAPDAIAAAFRGPMAQARRAKVGLLLRPTSPHDGELFGIRLPRRAHGVDPPGRGWLATHGNGTLLQLADPGSAESRTDLELSACGAGGFD
jgi:DNA segregation ATPase FtsK/SpoIIIE, S-DNA-T family